MTGSCADGPNVGDIVYASGEIVSPEEHARRQAALTPERRRMQERITGHFSALADELRRAHEAEDRGPVTNPTPMTVRQLINALTEDHINLDDPVVIIGPPDYDLSTVGNVRSHHGRVDLEWGPPWVAAAADCPRCGRGVLRTEQLDVSTPTEPNATVNGRTVCDRCGYDASYDGAR